MSHAAHILCLGDEVHLRALQWSFEKSEFPSRRLQFYSGDVLNQADFSPGDFDCVVCFVDLGQPTPTTLFKRTAPAAGLAIFQQPTPQQLLSLSTLSDWRPLVWNGNDYAFVLKNLAVYLDQLASSKGEKKFLSAFRSWLASQDRVPHVLEWINPPKHWAGWTKIYLQDDARLITLGQDQSMADYKIPVSGNQELITIQSDGAQSRIRSTRSGERPLLPGLRFRLNEFEFIAKKSPLIEDLHRLMRDSGAEAPAPRNLSPSSSAGDIIMEALVCDWDGTIELESFQKQVGIVYVDRGRVSGAVCGSVLGLKALERMLRWQVQRAQLIADRGAAGSMESSLAATAHGLDLNLSEFHQLIRAVEKNAVQVEQLKPPAGLRLEIQPKVLFEKGIHSCHELEVLYSVSQHQRCFEIINYTRLSDRDIIIQLVNLKQSGILIPHRAQTSQQLPPGQ